MKDFLLNFKLKGNRNYIHGTDIYSKISAYLNSENFQVSNINLSFHKIVTHNLKGKLFSGDTISSDIKNPACVFKFIHNMIEPQIICLFETDERVTESYAYDEEKITDAAKFNNEDKSISLTSAIRYKNIEKVVALNKVLLTNLLTNSGKWYFIRLTTDGDINEKTPDSINLRLVKNKGSKITKTLILFDEREQGYIYFSKV
jgi:hypothetical protein